MKHSIEKNFSIESDGFKAIDRHWNTLWCFNIDTVMDLKYSTDIETFCDKGSDGFKAVYKYWNIFRFNTQMIDNNIDKWWIKAMYKYNIEYYFIKRKWWVLSKMN